MNLNKIILPVCVIALIAIISQGCTKQNVTESKNVNSAVCEGVEIVNVGCVVNKANANWQNAVNTCSENGFHLANRHELSEIYSSKNDKINYSGLYWSSEEDDENNGKAWGVRFDSGTAINGDKKFPLGVLCVN